MNCSFLLRVVYPEGSDGEEESLFLDVFVPIDRDCTIKEYISRFVREHTHLEFADVSVFSFVGRFDLD